jgi:hypothetical protein
MRAFLLTLAVVLVVPVAEGRAAPSLTDVVASPASYAGRVLTFPKLLLSGTVYKYDFEGVRKYYLLVQTGGKRLDLGFLLAPPAVADKLTDYMKPRTNYSVNLTCKVERITINSFPQWHGTVSKVEFLDADGKVVKTIEQARKKK